jgi:hypothetical protein
MLPMPENFSIRYACSCSVRRSSDPADGWLPRQKSRSIPCAFSKSPLSQPLCWVLFPTSLLEVVALEHRNSAGFYHWTANGLEVLDVTTGPSRYIFPTTSSMENTRIQPCLAGHSERKALPAFSGGLFRHVVYNSVPRAAIYY